MPTTESTALQPLNEEQANDFMLILTEYFDNILRSIRKFSIVENDSKTIYEIVKTRQNLIKQLSPIKEHFSLQEEYDTLISEIKANEIRLAETDQGVSDLNEHVLDEVKNQIPTINDYESMRKSVELQTNMLVEKQKKLDRLNQEINILYKSK